MGNDRKFYIEFIELYKSFPCLWNRSDPKYRNTEQKDIAYSFLVEKMKEIDIEASKFTVTSKINILRSNYRKEQRKILASEENNEIHVPLLWYYNNFRFIEDQLEPPKSRKTESPKFEYCEVENHKVEKDEINDLESGNENEISFEEPAEKKRKLSFKNMQSNKPNNNVEICQNVTNIELEHTAFGNHIAEEIRNLPQEMIPYVKKIINDAIFEGHMTSLNRFSKIVTTPRK